MAETILLIRVEVHEGAVDTVFKVAYDFGNGNKVIETRNCIVLWINPIVTVSDYVFWIVAGYNGHYEVSTENYSQTSNNRKLWTYFTGGTNTSMDTEYDNSCFNWDDRLRAC